MLPGHKKSRRNQTRAVFDCIGLLLDEPPGLAGLPFNESSDGCGAVLSSTRGECSSFQSRVALPRRSTVLHIRKLAFPCVQLLGLFMVDAY